MLTTTIIGMGRIGEITMAGNATTGSSLKAAMVSRVMYRALDGPFVVLLEEDSAGGPGDGVVMGKMPRPQVRRLISPPLVEWIFDQWSAGKPM
jgi:hypothetical protein